jgi:hypothetical protein
LRTPKSQWSHKKETENPVFTLHLDI